MVVFGGGISEGECVGFAGCGYVDVAVVDYFLDEVGSEAGGAASNKEDTGHDSGDIGYWVAHGTVNGPGDELKYGWEGNQLNQRRMAMKPIHLIPACNVGLTQWQTKIRPTYPSSPNLVPLSLARASSKKSPTASLDSQSVAASALW